MAKYGRTYWGKQFLNALADIDYSNRLPRGRRYAGNGSVKSISIDKNVIKAKVQGSMIKPYNIRIKVPEFTNKQKKIMTEAVQSSPAVLASLLNRQLPPKLTEIAEENNIPLFPKAWNDFDMQCSCPDWAVPCKHLAAVIYLIANEIDLNPFLITELHGLDLLKDLSKLGLEIEDKAQEKIESLDKFFLDDYADTIDAPSIEGLDNLDFTLIPEYGSKLLDLLSADPPFHEKDIKKEVLTVVKTVSKKISRDYFGKEKAILKPDISYCIGCSIVFKGDSVLAELEYEEDVKQIPVEYLFRVFSNDESFSPVTAVLELKILYNFFLFCKKLLEQTAAAPEMFQLSNRIQILWQPLVQENSVCQQLEVLNNYHSLINIKIEVRNKIKYFNDIGRFSHFLSSIFMTAMVKDIYCDYRRYKAEDKILDMLFGFSQPYEEKQSHLYNSIQLWLNKIQSPKRNFVPILQIEDDYPIFRISMMIRSGSKDNYQTPLPFHEFKKKNKSSVISAAKDLMLLQDHFPEFNKIINSSKEEILNYNQQDFAEFLLKIIPVLKLLGVEIMLPKALKKLIKPSPTLKVKSGGGKQVRTYMDLKSVLDFEWRTALGDDVLSADEFFKLVKNSEGIIKYKENYVHVSKEDLNKLLKHLKDGKKLTNHELLQTVFANEYDGQKIELSEEIKRIIADFKKADTIPLPKSLNAELRPYQKRGFEWLYKNSSLGFGSILADDMGLGKTIQTLSFLLKLKEENRFLGQKAIIIVPATLLANWGKEIEKFTPALSYLIYHGNKRKIEEFENQDVFLTTYGTARIDADKLKKSNWHTLIIDEAQNIKNHKASQTKAIKSIKADIKIALSGTPVENRLSEYWSIFDFSNKGYLGSEGNFTKDFVKPITVEKSSRKIDIFRKITSPFIMRRLKTDKSIIKDLPEKIEKNQYCRLSKEQAALYESIVKEAMKKIKDSEGIERKGLVLKMMTSLKQIGNHPYQFLKSGSTSPELSGKTATLFDLLKNIIENNQKTLIFTQYKEMGKLLHTLISKEFKMKPLFLHGSLSRNKREVLIEDFQTKEHKRIFILSLKAGGTGLNLTKAENVIHYDLWWNPAVETQATDRAYRIGQKKNVLVHRLINKGTMEERIDDMINDKRKLADLAVGAGEKWIGELTNNELKDLVKLTKDI